MFLQRFFFFLNLQRMWHGRSKMKTKCVLNTTAPVCSPVKSALQRIMVSLFLNNHKKTQPEMSNTFVSDKQLLIFQNYHIICLAGTDQDIVPYQIGAWQQHLGSAGVFSFWKLFFSSQLLQVVPYWGMLGLCVWLSPGYSLLSVKR